MGKNAEKNKINWEQTYNQLKDFKKKNKDFPSKQESQRLYTWCAVQRLKKKKNILEDDKIKKLESIGFIWNVQDYIWQQNYEKLIEYRKENPERWPSQRSTEPLEHKLAVWFLGIRKDYRNGKLAQDRISKLKKIGFPFYPREYRWHNTFKKLKKFISKHKRFPAKSSKDQQEQKLYNWLRYQVIKIEYDVLESDQVNDLESIGIESFKEDLDQTA